MSVNLKFQKILSHYPVTSVLHEIQESTYLQTSSSGDVPNFGAL